MVLKYHVPETVKYWTISFKFTKDISPAILTSTRRRWVLRKNRPVTAFVRDHNLTTGNWRLNVFCNLSSTVRRPNGMKLRLTSSLCFIPIQPNAKTSIYQSLDQRFHRRVQSQRSFSSCRRITLKWGSIFRLSILSIWKITVKFSKPVAKISNINKARFAGRSQDRHTFYIENVPGQIQNANLKQCVTINEEFAGKLVSSPANKTLSAFVMFERKESEYTEINPPGLIPKFPTWSELITDHI